MGERVSYPSNGGTSEGYLAVPASGSGPAVIVIQEWWGLVPHIRSLADRFAEPASSRSPRTSTTASRPPSRTRPAS